MEAFAAAEAMRPGSYRLSVMSLEGGEIATYGGLKIMTEPADPNSIDTLIVVGDANLPYRLAPPATSDFIRAAAAKTRRTASVCSGAFLLAAAGLLDGRRATTHWRYAARLRAAYPSVRVDGDRIFINEGGIWTSAGMTAGIDMALALIEADLGEEVARSVARLLVVYYRRPGGQVQFSSLLELDPGSDRIRNTLLYAREHLAERLSVERLAEAACLSVRQFSRAFAAATGMTPAKAIERLRVEVARPKIEDSRETLDTIAHSVGFGDGERMRQSFLRVLGQTPLALRNLARDGEVSLRSSRLKDRAPAAPAVATD